jgi:hypothetical protein
VQRLGLLASAAITMLGCAQPLHLMERGASAGVSPYSFWPPPPSSTLWLPAPPSATERTSLGAVASELAVSLVEAGYAETRWYPIGSGYQHGFAVTTRLERLDLGSGSNTERCSAMYPEPANLRWLTFAQAPSLPQPGQYRAFLIAFTDLPMPSGTSAPIWDEQTLMDGPGAPERHHVSQVVAHRHVTPEYRFGVYEYLYDWDEARKRGRLNRTAGPATVPAWPLAVSGLAFSVNAPER